jgi:hypothetical protein
LAWETLIETNRKGWFQPIEQRKNKIQNSSKKQVQDIRKEGQCKDKERYRDVV